jgi:Ca-activated chloride channel family protein
MVEAMSGRAGLRTAEGKPVPLRAVRISGVVAGAFAQMTVEQRYRNGEARPVEAVYTFPLPSDASLVGFSMTCGGRQLEGKVREREEAFRIHDEALLRGDGSAMLEQERANVFTVSVGNLLPGEETLVEVRYAQKLQVEEGALRLAIPTLVAPRYIPGVPDGERTADGWADPTDRVPDADRITPRSGDATYGLSLELSIELGASVQVESPSHELRVRKDEAGRVLVGLARGEVDLDRDFVLLVGGVSDGPLSAFAAHRQGGEDGFVALTVVPDLQREGPETGEQRVVFVVDTSGSMEGASIEEARTALRLCLRQLREGDLFNVIAFNDRHRAFAPEPVPFTQATLERADDWVRSLHAAGGTEILEPLLRGVREAHGGVVVLLTDGQVGNEDEVRREVLGPSAGARIYAFGIGTNVSDALLRALAQGTDGAVESIYPGERVDEKVIAQFARATAPRVRDVRVEAEGVDLDEIAPSRAPALVDGEPWCLFARYKRAGSGRVVLRGKLGAEPWALEVPVLLAAEASCPPLPRLWAAERIRDLEAAELTGRRARAMKERIVDLAVRHGVSSRYTAFLVVEERTGDRRAKEAAATRVVPVHLPAGWAMFEEPRGMGAYAANPAARVLADLASCPPGPAGAAGLIARGVGAVLGAAVAPIRAAARHAPADSPSCSTRGSSRARAARASLGRAAMDALAGGFSGAPDEAPPPPRPHDPVIAILERQLATGLWPAARTHGDRTARQLVATARAMLELLALGVDTSHKVHGAQVRKAVAAVVAEAPRAAEHGVRAVSAALAAAWLAASGRRERKRVVEAIDAAGARELAALIGDAARVREYANKGVAQA